LKEEKQERQYLKRQARYGKQDIKEKTKKVKRILHSKVRKFDSRESQLFLKFLATQPDAILKHDAVELVWTFMMFLKSSGYHILHGNTIFCMPLTRMIKMKDL
jgi:hypothetical protein